MLFGNQCVRSILMAAALLTQVIITGCVTHVGVGYRVYDPYHRDYHAWDGPEVGYYNQWIIETHRPNREYRKLPRHEQRDYWMWRHNNHPEHR